MRKSTSDKLLRDGEYLRTINEGTMPGGWTAADEPDKEHIVSILSVDGGTAVLVEYAEESDGFEIYTQTPNSITATRKAIGLPI